MSATMLDNDARLAPDAFDKDQKLDPNQNFGPPTFHQQHQEPLLQQYYSQQQQSPNNNLSDNNVAESSFLGVDHSTGIPHIGDIPALIDRTTNYNHPTTDSLFNEKQTGADLTDLSSADDFTFSSSSNSPLSKMLKTFNSRYQLLLDLSTPYIRARWSFSLVLLLVFLLRIIFAQGWYIICYALSLYYLSMFIAFLSPRIDPAFQPGGEFADDFLDDDSDSGPMLPTSANQEFKPFVRRLPEFKFWLEATRATLLSLFLTLFEIFDFPVFWPILFIYFIMLFISMMRQQIRHMWRYKYVPWTRGKRRYGGNKEDSAKLYPTVI